jgi:hypothetical protein
MERDLGEVLESQNEMLRRLGQTTAPREEIARAFGLHLNRLHKWLAEQPNFAVLRIGYANVVARTAEAVARINEFLGGRLDPVDAGAAVDPSLYRNKKPADRVAG